MLSVKQQTECENKIRMFLQSIASLAVDAQSKIGQHDKIFDTIELIESDIQHLKSFAIALALSTDIQPW